MNCRQVQSLVSPYLDQRLSGHLMMEMEAHFHSCSQCAEERNAVQQVRLALRALPTHIPRQTLEARMVMDAARREPLFFMEASASARLPQRGRRLAMALTLSGVGLLTLSAPFAPSTFDVAQRAYRLRPGRAEAAVPGIVFGIEMNSAALPGMTLVRLSQPSPAIPVYTPSVVATGRVAVPASSLPLSVWSASPLPAQGGTELSLVGYHSR